MPLTSEEIAAVVAECAPLVAGSRVDHVHQAGDHELYLTLRSPAAGTLILLFSARPRLSRVHVVPDRPPAPPSPPPFCEAARKHLRGARIERLRQVSGDRVVELAAVRREDGVERRVSLILEMTGSRPRLALVESAPAPPGGRGPGEERRLVAALRPLTRAGREVLPGEPYRFPAARAQPAPIRAIAGSPWRYLDASIDEGALAPFSLAIARHYGRLEAEEALRERKEALLARLRRRAARAAGVAEKVREDLERAEAGDAHRVHGELLKGALPRLRRGMTEVELENWFEPGVPRITVPLDPALGPRENLEKIFRRYQKSRRALPILKDRLERVEAEIERDRRVLEAAAAASTLAAIEAVEREAGPGGGRGGRREEGAVRAKGPRRTEASGPRRFLSAGGHEILVGRNARQNDELSLRTARGNDIFLHVAGRPGSHVIVRAPQGKAVPLETLLDGAQLALYYSLPERQRSAPGLSAAGDVDYTPAKHLRKPRGARPGLVLLSTHKSLRVRIEPERLARLRASVREGDAPPGGG